MNIKLIVIGTCIVIIMGIFIYCWYLIEYLSRINKTQAKIHGWANVIFWIVLGIALIVTGFYSK
jgi:hypothetical protein